MRRLHEMRDIADLILRFGPYKGMTFGQVACRLHPPARHVAATRGPRCGMTLERLLHAHAAKRGWSPAAKRGWSEEQITGLLGLI